MAYKKFTNSAAQLKPDTKFESLLLGKFINYMMYDGKKSVATRMVYDALEIVAKRVPEKPPNEIFEEAINKCRPSVEVRSRRVGGSNYQVPMPVTRKRQTSLAFRWIRDASRARGGKPTCMSLAQEIVDAYRGEGTAFQTRTNMHRMADANKAFAHFAW